MRISRTLVILFLAIAGCNKGEKKAQVGGEKICELHHQPLKSVSGYAAGPTLMVDPGYGVTEFNTQFGDRYPHIIRVAFSSSRGDGWTKEITFDVCEECEKNYSRDFATYLKTDEKERWDQYMKFLVKNRPSSRDATNPDSDGGDSDTGTDSGIDYSNLPVLPPLSD
jgi:hypothetical protein